MTKKSLSKRRKFPGNKRVTIPWERVTIYLIALFVFCLPLFIWPGVSEYGYGKSIFALIGISVLLVLWGLSAWQKGEGKIRFPWVAFPALGLILASLLSLIHALNGRVVIQSLTLFAFFALFTLIVVNVVKEKRDVTLLLYSLLLSSFFASLYGLLQYLGIMRGAHGGHGLSEVISVMGNRNYLGGFLSYLLFPSVILLVRLRSWALRSIAIGLLSFNFGMAMLVQQTGIVVALIIALVTFFVGLVLFRPITPIRQNRGWLLALLFFLVFTFLVEAPSGPLNSVVGFSSEGSSWLGRLWAQNAGRVRAWDWWVGWEMFKDHPVVGVGLGNYKLDFLPYKARFLSTPQGANYNFYIERAAQAHNEYIQFAAELGCVGILALVAFLVTLPWTLWRRLRANRSEGDRLDLLLFSCGIAVFLVHALVSFPAHLPSSSLAFALIFGLAASAAYGETAEIQIRLKGWPLKTLVVVLAVLSLTVSVIAARDFSANLLMQKGYRQLQLGQDHLAETTLERSLRYDFAPAQTYLLLAKAGAKLGHYEEALEDAKRCLTRFVDENVYLFVINLAVNLDKTKIARENVDLLLATMPHPNTRKEAEYLRALVTLQEGDPFGAINELETLKEKYPAFEKLYLALGKLYSMQRLNDSARENYERALQLIDAELERTEKRLASLTAAAAAGKSVPFETYSDLQENKRRLEQEKEIVKAGLAELPPP